MFIPLGVGVGVYSLLVGSLCTVWAAAVGLRTSFCTRNHRLMATVIPFCSGLQVPVVLRGYQACSCSLLWPFVHGPATLVLPCVLQPHQLSFGRAGEASVVVQFPLALRRLVGRSLL